jgi:DnaJ-class molecular chaperone
MSDNDVTYEGVIYHLVENLPPLKTHVVTCPRCDGVGLMYGRSCRECNGRGLLYPPVSHAPTASATAKGGE